MANRRKIVTISLWWLASAPLWGGTGRPSDGFLSFILLLGFLGVLFGILSVVDLVKRKIWKFLEEIGEAMH